MFLLTSRVKWQVNYLFISEYQWGKTESNANFDLPDGKTISVGSQRIRCPEALFDPSLAGK